MRCALALALVVLPSTSIAGAPSSGAPPSARIHTWREVDDVVDGWDWSLPPDVRPAERSGVSFSGPAPPGFPGRRLERVAWSWARLEPEEGVYDFESLRREIERVGRRRDGVVLQILGATVRTEIRVRGRPVEREGTAPSWLVDRYGVAELPSQSRTNLATPFTVHNLDPADPELHRRYLAMAHSFGESGIPAMPEIAFVVVSGVSASRGEEAGLVARDERTVACMNERLDAWADAFRGAEWKLAWVGDGDGDRAVLEHAYALGMGQRCGTAERYLMHVVAPQLGQSLDPEGYLITDESCPPIAGKRAFGDENEEYDPEAHVPRFGPVDGWPHRYREAMLRALQMRRNWLWVERQPWVDPPLLSWVSLELGRTVEDAPDAWCELRESRVRVAGEKRTVKNFERWLVQRDRDGVRTVPAFPSPPGGEAEEEWTARRTDRAGGNGAMGFAVDDRFLSGGPHDVAVKVTYVDRGTGSWELALAGDGGETVRTVRCEGTDRTRTATFFRDAVRFPARGADFDFEIRAGDGDAVIRFVRVIKRGRRAP